MQQNISLVGSLGRDVSAHPEALLVGRWHLQTQGPAVQQEGALARGSTNAASVSAMRSMVDGCEPQRTAGAAATLGVPSHTEEPLHRQAQDLQAVSSAAPPPLLGCGDAVAIGSVSPQDGESATKHAGGDSGQLFGSQASAATRASGAIGCGSIGNSNPLGGGSSSSAVPCSNSPSPPPCQHSGSDKASEAAAGSGCGGGGGGGGSGSGSGSEFQPSEQGFSTPPQVSSESDNPSLSGKDRERLKRRLANRGSAQRVRQRRRLEFDAMQNKLASMVGDTQRLVARITAAEAARDATAQQLQALQSQMDAEHAAHAQLQMQGAAASVGTAASTASAGTAVGGDTAPPQGGLPQQLGSGNAGNGHVSVVMGPSLPMQLGGAAKWPVPAGAMALPAVAGGAAFAGPPAAGGYAAFPGIGSQWQSPPMYIGPLTTGMPGQRGLPPPSVRIRTQPHCCIVSSGFAPAGGKAAQPGASAAAANALAPNPHPRSQRLRQRTQQAAANPMSPAAASAHARLAAQLAHKTQPQLQRPPLLQHQQQLQLRPQPRTQVQHSAQAARSAGTLGGAAAAAAAALMPVPLQQSAASAAAAGATSAAGVPAASPFAAYSLLPFADE